MFELIRANKRRSALLIAGFVVLLSLVGAAFGCFVGSGPAPAIIALVFSGAMAFASYWKADSIALAVSRAKPADPQQYQRLHNLVEGLCIAAGLPKPRVFIVDDPAPNAFATGRNPKHAAIAVTTGSAREDEPCRAGGRHRPRAVARAQLRHLGVDAGSHSGRLDRPAHQHRHADDVVERWPRASRRRSRRRQPAGHPRPRVPDLRPDHRQGRCRLRSAAAARRWPTSALAR